MNRQINLDGIAKLLCVILIVFAAFSILGLVGRSEYNDEVIYSMSSRAYEEITLELGDSTSKSRIVDTYMSRKRYYDSLE